MNNNISNYNILNNNLIPGAEILNACQDSAAERVKCLAFKALFWIVWVFTAAIATAMVIPAITAIIQKVRSHYKHKQIIQSLAENRYKAVRDALERERLLSASMGIETLRGSYENRVGFVKQIEGLLDRMRRLSLKKNSPPSSGLHDSMQAFRSEIDQILSSSIYQTNRDQKDHPGIQILQLAAHTLVSNSPEIREFEKYGAKKAKDIGLSLNYTGLADTLQKVVDRDTIFSKTNLIQKLFWIFTHPEKALAAALDNTVKNPLKYNSYQLGNASIQMGFFQVRGTTYSLSQSPTFTADRLTEAARDYGEKRIFQDIEEENGPRGERARVAAKRSICDPDLKGKEGKILHLHTPIDVHRESVANAFGLNSKLAQAVDLALGDNEKAKAIAFASLKGLQAMVDQSRVLGKKTAYLNQSCKQNIDRGLVVNVATILFADAISGRKLSQKRVHQILGMTLVRAGMVDDRAILAERLNPLLDVLKAMEEKPELLKAIRSHFGRRAISFETAQKTIKPYDSAARVMQILYRAMFANHFPKL